MTQGIIVSPANRGVQVVVTDENNVQLLVDSNRGVSLEIVPQPRIEVLVDKGVEGAQGPVGPQGPQGPQGTAATVTAGTTTTGAAGTNAIVTNAGTSSAAVFNFTIPRGDTGATGATGAGVAVGGTTGQVLVKASGVNYDTTWATITGTLVYQGSWNASTNTPTLTSSVGTNGYYYVVGTSGSTNLNGITDWVVGDWAIFNGTIWQKIDNTDLVSSVNGQTGVVVLTASSVGALAIANNLSDLANAGTARTNLGLGTIATQNANSVAITGGTESGVTHSGDTIGTYLDYTGTSAPSYVEGRTWYDSNRHAFAYYNDSPNDVVHIGQDLIIKVINNTGSTIPNGSPVYITSTSSGQIYPNVALARADVSATASVIGLTNGAISNGSIGYVTSQGGIDNVNTSTFTVGQVLYLSPYSAGQLMNTVPPTGITVQVGVVQYVNSSTGVIYVKQTTPLTVPASIITGQVAIANGGTGASTASGARTNLGLGTIATQDANNVAITGGTINGTTVGATTASTGRFSDLTDTGLTSGRVVYASTGGNLVDASNFTYDGTNLVAGAIQNTPIGATTPATGVFTTLTAQTEVLTGTGQNLLLYSEVLNDTSWTTNSPNVTISANATTAPNGTTTADKVIPTVTNTSHIIRQFITNYQGLSYVQSIYAKAEAYSVIQIVTSTGFDGGGQLFKNFLLSSGTLGSGTLPATITSVGSGWYRISVVATATSSSTGARFNINVLNADTASANPSYAGDGTSGVFLWGAQLEIGSTLNTYIPTTTTAIYGTPTLSFSGVSTIGLQSDGSLYVQPAGTGALQAQATTSSAVGGNARGANAVDWQTARDAASRVASSQYSVVSGGYANTASGFISNVSGGSSNLSQGNFNFIGGGGSNTANSNFVNSYSAIVGGRSNTANGFYNFNGGGFTNSGTSASAVTTQSGTMNATTAVTLSGSNANIKVGQYITGTSIADDTYVAAISGTSLTLSKVASGSSTSTLSFFTPHGVVVGGGNNQATGSYSFIGGGGDAGSSANRNVASGDWSVVGGGWRNTASGAGSFVGGGGYSTSGSFPNTASATNATISGGALNSVSGLYATVGGGVANTASGISSVIIGGGQATTRSINGMQAFSYGQFTTAGDNQIGTYQLGKITTDATPSVVTIGAGAAGTTNQVILPNNSAYYFKGSVIANVTGAANGASWSFEGAIMRGANAASTVLIGTPAINRVAATAGATAWLIALTADTTNGGLAVTVTGAASTTIRWVCKAETTEVTF